MLQPKRVKYRKSQRGRRRGNAQAGNTIAFGEYGLQAQERCWLTARQIEAARRAIVRYVRRGGKLWVRVYPDKPISLKPLETRQGGGKAATDHWACVTKPGKMLFEIAGIKEDAAREAMRLASNKLPIPTRFVRRDDDIS